MFNIDFSIINASFDDLEVITEEELRYNFLLGNVVFNSANTSIDMQWEWIPLLDFSYSLFQIVKSLSYKENSFESFEFTESTENIKFMREGSILKILPSFSPNTLCITFDEFDNAVQTFHKKISMYIKENIHEVEKKKSLTKFLFN